MKNVISYSQSLAFVEHSPYYWCFVYFLVQTFNGKRAE